jgi:hypothetical protein
MAPLGADTAFGVRGTVRRPHQQAYALSAASVMGRGCVPGDW